MSGPPSSALHHDAVATLTRWTAPSPHQDRLRADYLLHLARHPDALDRSGPPAHLTASCLVLDASLTRVLLTHHRKADRWFQLGGHCEPGDRTLRDAAAREAAEESGIADLALTAHPVHLDRHELVGSFGRCLEHLDVRFAAVAPSGARPLASEESHDVRWWPIDDLPVDDDADLRPLVTAALASVR